MTLSGCRPIGPVVILAGLALVSGSSVRADARTGDHAESTPAPRLVLEQIHLTSSDAETPGGVRSVRTTRIIETASAGTTRVAHVQQEWRADNGRSPVQTGIVQKGVTYALGGLLKLDDRHRRLGSRGDVVGDWYSRVEGVHAETLPELEFRVGAILELAFSSLTEDFHSGVTTRYRHTYRLEAKERMAAHDYWQHITPPDGELTDLGDVWRFSLDWTIFDEAGDQLSRRVRDYYLSSALSYVVPCCSQPGSTLQVLALVTTPLDAGAR